MTNGWPRKMLGDICQVFADGDWVESKDQSPQGIRLIQTGNVGEGLFKDRGEKARYVSEATFKRLRCTEIFEGDCLISRLPDPVGRSCLLPNTGERMITAVDCTIVRFNPRQLLPEFFNYYSQSLEYLKAVDNDTTGTTRKRISRSKLAEVTIPVPPISEQRRLVGILDEACEAIETARTNAEKNVQNARELFQGYLESVFSHSGDGWVERELGDVFEIGSSKRVLEREWTANGVPFYGGKEVVRLAKFGTVVSNAYISEEKYRHIATHYGVPKTGDILMTARGTIGVGYVVKEGDRFYYKDGNLMCLSPKTPTSPRFLLYAFRSHAVLGQLESLTGATVTHLPIEKANGLRLHFPDFPVQNRIVQQLAAIEGETARLVALYEQKLAALDRLKKSLLYQAFTGEL